MTWMIGVVAGGISLIINSNMAAHIHARLVLELDSETGESKFPLHLEIKDLDPCKTKKLWTIVTRNCIIILACTRVFIVIVLSDIKLTSVYAFL